MGDRVATTQRLAQTGDAVSVRVLRQFWKRDATPQRPAIPDAGPDPEVARRRRLLLARQRLSGIFTPSGPVAAASAEEAGDPDGSSLIGREAEREQILRALVEDRMHVLIHGDRGMGKTSLANFAVAQLHRADFMLARHVCAAGAGFDTILGALVGELRRVAAARDPELAGRLPARPLPPVEARAALEALGEVRAVLVVDEFDRIADDTTRVAFADLLKYCSDRRLPLSFLLVGVAETAGQLLGGHPSVQRCLARLALPLLADAEIERIVARGEEAGLSVPPPLRRAIATLARGMPYMAQLLSLRAGQAALTDGRMELRGEDLRAAIDAAIAEADPVAQTLYDRVTAGGRDAAMVQILRAAAAGARDAFGRFAAGNGQAGFRVAGIAADPAAFRRALGAGAMRPVPQSSLYAFGCTLLRPLVLLRTVQERRAA
jgi:hypothetical protein